MDNEGRENSQDAEQPVDSHEPKFLEKQWNRINNRLTSSRIPFLLLGSFIVLVVAKIILILFLDWMIVDETVPNSWLYIDPYDANDIAGTPEIILGLANRWDSQHFIEIARNGYPSGEEIPLLYAFAPFYPWMIAVVGQAVGNLYLAGVIVSNTFYFLSIISFYKVARLYMDYELSCLITIAFGLLPTYFTYGTLAYSEAPYLFFASASWYFFKKKQYFLCSIFMTFSILTRYISLLLVLVYGLIILSNLIDRYREEKSLLKAFDLRILWFLIPGVCLMVLFLYFQSLTGHFFAAFEAHAWFGDSLTTPLHQFKWFFEGYFAEMNPGVDTILLMLQRYMFTIPFLVLTLLLLKDDVELGFYGVLFMWFTLSMEGISGIASPRIMLSAWVAMLAFKDRISSALTIVMSVMFFLLGLWVMHQFQLTFFA
ncbi:MAG: mannosyltransferase family protein [Promethearchaeota archaeon]